MRVQVAYLLEDLRRLEVNLPLIQDTKRVCAAVTVNTLQAV